MRERSSFAPVAWWGVGALIVCLAGLLLARSADERLAPWAALAACVPLLPLVPSRYGDAIDPRGVSNLVKGMPTFAALAYILGLAAMGLPPFGPFTGFVNQAIELPLAAWGGLGIVLVVWLVASWCVIGMIHRVLFGPDRPALGRTVTLSGWCDALLGTRIVNDTDDQLVTWIGLFIDEGQAAYEMPDRGQGLHATWKALAAREWTTVGIADARHKIAALPDDPGDALL